jgi:hypothetical protein
VFSANGPPDENITHRTLSGASAANVVAVARALGRLTVHFCWPTNRPEDLDS